MTEPDDCPAVPALRLGGRRGRGRDPRHWDALRQLKRVPQWDLVKDATCLTCQRCILADEANEAVCQECPAVELIAELFRQARHVPVIGEGKG